MGAMVSFEDQGKVRSELGTAYTKALWQKEACSNAGWWGVVSLEGSNRAWLEPEELGLFLASCD